MTQSRINWKQQNVSEDQGSLSQNVCSSIMVYCMSKSLVALTCEDHILHTHACTHLWEKISVLFQEHRGVNNLSPNE